MKAEYIAYALTSYGTNCTFAKQVGSCTWCKCYDHQGCHTIFCCKIMQFKLTLKVLRICDEVMR